MIDYEVLKEFIILYYKDKDIMHDLSHIERVIKTVKSLMKYVECNIDYEVIVYAAYFHGFIYNDDENIKIWLKERGFSEEKIEFIVKVAWESQKNESAETIEGKLLHDAHMVEGGKTFLIVKSLITGSVRGQTLDETIEYIEKNILGTGCCYFEEAKKIYNEAQKFAKEFINELKIGLNCGLR
ncbi:hypothetical protein [Abyssisolibacter fermentans]|uniref:hypothetical protein n=1 Tax=Abyssisolibacter fermentans TaxID=1766203 RepID=UPI00082C73A3|nr:hypothetical protein [Abyssisolibacter fermentans]